MSDLISGVERREIKAWLVSVGGQLQKAALKAQVNEKLLELRELCRDSCSAEEVGAKAIRAGGYLDALEYIIGQEWLEHVIFEEDKLANSKEVYYEDDDVS